MLDDGRDDRGPVGAHLYLAKALLDVGDLASAERSALEGVRPRPGMVPQPSDIGS
jgi:hypothetical protein